MRSTRRRTISTLACVIWAAVVCYAQPQRVEADDRTNVWVDSRVCGPFVVWAEFPLDGYRRLLGQLAGLQNDLQEYLGVPRASEAIEVYLFRDKQSYSRFIKANLRNVPYRRALYIKRQGPGQVFAYRSRQIATDLRHESTHALLHAVQPMVPLWLDEGLAEFFEVAPEKRAFENPHLGSLRWNLLLGNATKLESLEKTRSIGDLSQADYRHAWAWTHFMLLGPPQAREELVGYLSDIRAKTPPGHLSMRLGRRFSSPRRSLSAHFKSWKR